MNTIKAIVRNGQLELNQPINLPDGTVLSIPLPTNPDTLGIRDEDWSNAPEDIEAWNRWLDALEPFEFTAEERAAWHAARKEQKDYELAQWDKRSKQIEDMFP